MPKITCFLPKTIFSLTRYFFLSSELSDWMNIRTDLLPLLSENYFDPNINNKS